MMNEKLTKKLDIFLLAEMERQTVLLNNLIGIKDHIYMSDEDKDNLYMLVKLHLNYRKNLFNSFGLTMPEHEELFWERFIKEMMKKA